MRAAVSCVRKHQMRAHEVFLIAHRNRAANNSRQRWLEPRLGGGPPGRHFPRPSNAGSSELAKRGVQVCGTQNDAPHSG